MYCLVLNKRNIALEKLHYNFVVTGKVQGVWFRKYTKDFAISIGLTGFVKNLDSGEVYVAAEGFKNQLNQLEKWLHKGSPMANVTSVQKEKGVLLNFKNFEIQP